MIKIPQIVIIGRINVGKSALFNRLTESSKAIVSKVAGTTRDYNFATVNWQGRVFNLIDTGGVNSDLVQSSIKALATKKFKAKAKTDDPIEIEIIRQTKTALQKADLILLVVDAQAGVMPQDKELVNTLKRIKKTIILVCNKADNPKLRNQTSEFFQLGLGQPVLVSAINGSGTGDLLDVINKNLKIPRGRPKTVVEKPTIKIAIVGRPNVGKSSLVNKILGEQRVIVSPVAQTTREPQDTIIDYKDYQIILIDTAGLRKKGKIERGIEKQAARKTLEVLKKADVALLVTEAQTRLTSQDNHLAGLIKDTKDGLIIVGNKWDLIRDKTPTIDREMMDYYRQAFSYLSFAPIVFVSAFTGRNVEKILDQVIAVYEQKSQKIEDIKLASLLKKIVAHKSPVQAKGMVRPYIYSLVQSRVNPPQFTITIGKGQSIHFSYLRYIENQIREKFDFFGAPIRLKIEKVVEKRLKKN
ncbi:MAG: ribosome biogenesis GTPase Der [Candidatus Buchananbacteria bacterium]|nr:ribosome biogenesis GTPase Der [Candidatus Buchananbacteria bacterium]